MLYNNRGYVEHNILLLKKAKFYWNCIVDERYVSHIQYLMQFLESKYKKCIDCSILLSHEDYDDISVVAKLIKQLKEQNQLSSIPAASATPPTPTRRSRNDMLVEPISLS